MANYSQYFTGEDYEGGLGTSVSDQSLTDYLGQSMVDSPYAGFGDIHSPDQWGQDISYDQLTQSGAFQDEMSGILLDEDYQFAVSGMEGAYDVVTAGMDSFQNETGIDPTTISSWSSEEGRLLQKNLTDYCIEK